MLVLISYDVNTEAAEGKARLRHVAKICEDYGQRVQNSVFECLLEPPQLCKIKDKLKKAIDQNNDSLRFYYLGNKFENKIETIGKSPEYDVKSDLIF